ncbi:glycosyltransferase family 2 protein [Flavobacterium saccharophilum]|uniref:Glycosyltransferase involved in cell wall bisynthesis n=1 Tax=Flavobacterium saccharophilum TaxID=29534 RepID=A0A1M7K802_9FLAO|nr:glycosyltransferase [Flavobacterium saccharophilum]SHM61113.1 Glycosyltransferase involved in cell wall bisynthesis [Flavobacterium saccharophilum]
MDSNSILVTAIITTYNRTDYLEKAIQSVVNQSYSNIEVLVIDDGSKVNDAKSICAKFLSCNYIYKENGGLSSTRNFGINIAKGEFVAFLDDDDFWESSKIEKQVKILLENPAIDCVHSSAAVVDENGKLTGEIIGAAQNKIHKRSGYVFWNALGSWVVKSPTPLIRKKVFQPDLMFDENIKVGEDVDFYQRMFYRHKVFYINEPLAFYRQYEDENRLSVQLEKYIGIEKKMYLNFIKMGINNPFILYRIALRLLKSAEKKWNQVFLLKPISISKFDFYFRPVYCLKNYFNT